MSETVKVTICAWRDRYGEACALSTSGNHLEDDRPDNSCRHTTVEVPLPEPTTKPVTVEECLSVMADLDYHATHQCRPPDNFTGCMALENIRALLARARRGPK